jgi:hypothetical protein
MWTVLIAISSPDAALHDMHRPMNEPLGKRRARHFLRHSLIWHDENFSAGDGRAGGGDWQF